jgi:hypothetical protein
MVLYLMYLTISNTFFYTRDPSKSDLLIFDSKSNFIFHGMNNKIKILFFH